MLMDGQKPVGKRPWGMIASAALHLIGLAILLHRPEPVIIEPRSVALGDLGKATHVVYVPPDSASGEPEPVEKNRIAFKTVAHKRHAKPAPIKARQMPEPNPQGEVAEANHREGVQYGDLWSLMKDGHDVKPAIPVEYPAPDVSHSELPFGFQGDVVIEATIERDGTVTDVRVLKSINQGVDKKCLAAVQRWRFRPAVLDGSPIASKHDVHFHFPS